MVIPRCLPLVLLAALSGAVQAQDTGAQTGGAVSSRPSAPSVPMIPSGGDAEDASVDGRGARRAPLPSPNARTPGSPNARGAASGQLLGPGAFGSPGGAGLENVLNSGTPPAYDRKSGGRKVCPPELE